MSLVEKRRQDVPLHAEIATLLRHQIHSGALKEGDQLPPLSELTTQMGVARMTIRQAMDSLEEEGLIARQSGRGTFVKAVPVQERQSLKMRADFAELSSMVSQLEVSVGRSEPQRGTDGFMTMSRLHSLDGKPFCLVDIRLDAAIYDRAPGRFDQEIVVTVFKDLDLGLTKASQRVGMSFADFVIAEDLGIPLNSPVFRVHREFHDEKGALIYEANLIYPGDRLEFDIEFALPEA